MSNNSVSVSDIAHFIQNYRTAIILPEVEKVEAFPAAFLRLKAGLQQIKEEIGAREISEAPDFNVFYLLGVARDETRTHSAFLANLLNPSGSHGQGDLFLHSFLYYCQNKFPDFPRLDEIGKDRWSAYTEMVTPQGRLDIVLINPILGFLCLIENKIDAIEQPRQLQRYSKWLDTRQHVFPIQALIYLTIHGQEASTNWGRSYFRLSYRHDITAWLENTLRDIQAAGVLAVVRQYLDVVYRL